MMILKRFKNYLFITLALISMSSVSAEAVTSNSLLWEDICYSDDWRQDYDSARSKQIEKSLNVAEYQMKRRTVPKGFSKKAISNQNTVMPQEERKFGEYLNYVYTDYAQKTQSEENEAKKYPEIYKKEEEFPIKKFTIGTDFSYMKNREPNYGDDDGGLYGIMGAISYKVSNNENIKNWGDVLRGSNNKPNIYKLDAKMSWGKFDYFSASSGSMSDIKNRLFEIRGVLGYDIPFYESFLLTPYVGAGYRYRYEDRRGTFSKGASGTRRSQNYFYIPIGLEFLTELEDEWSLGMTMEYDLFIYGKERSRLEDTGLDVGNATFGQTRGFGARGSCKLEKQNETWSFFVEPFIRYWNIAESKSYTVNIQGVGSLDIYKHKHRSTEVGLKLGATF